MFPTFISILDIQSWWEVPSIAHFCSLFRTAFNLLDFDIEDLEEALLTDGTEETSWLQELIVRLLSGCLPSNEISTFNYQMFLRRLFRQKCQEHDRYNPFNTDVDFQLLPLRAKVDILTALCDFRLDAEDVLEQLKNLEADSLRVEPLGYDSNESAYWYFYGTRLYREDFNVKNNKKKSVWQVICFTEDDWFQLDKKFKKSTVKCERQLHRTLTENFLPELPRLFREKERLARKRLLDNQPRRTSQRLRKVENGPDKEELIEEAPSKEAKDDPEEDPEEKQSACDLESKRHEAHERRNRLKEHSEDSQSDRSVEGRHEMGGAKNRPKKSKGRQRKLSTGSNNSKDGAKSGKRKKSGEKASSTSTSTATVGRQTNNSLAAATGQIVIQPVANPHKKKLKTSQVFRQTDEDLLTGMHKILDHVKNHEDAWPFADPVDEDYAPNYYTVIRKPMDLQRMEDRLDAGYYKNFVKFRDDFQLIVDNCRLYNGAENEYTEMVDTLLKAFERATEKFLDQISSSDDEIAVEFPSVEADGCDAKRSKSSSKRKPTLAAKTDRKRHRSLSEDSISKRSESSMILEKKPRKLEEKKPIKKISKGKEKPETKKTAVVVKDKKSASKIAPKHKKVKNSTSPLGNKNKSRSRSISRSPPRRGYSSSPPPSSVPSSPDTRFDFFPKKRTKVPQERKESSASPAPKSRHRPKHEKFKSLFDNEPELQTKKPPEQRPSATPKPKDKHDKLRETIEKLKAKSEISNKLTESEFCFDLDNPKENKSKHGRSPKKDAKSNRTKRDLNDYEDSNDSFEEISDRKVKKVNSKSNKPESEQTLKDINKWLDDSPPAIKANAKKKNAKNAAIEALSIATEQTLKDINKWLDDTPKFNEFSSASNSPSYGALEEFEKNTDSNDSRKRMLEKCGKRDDSLNSARKDVKRRAFTRDPGKFLKRREIQRTIDRLQPGKGKGNLLSNVPSSKQQDEVFPLGQLSAKAKDMKNSLIVKTDDNAPKLSLGTVLDSFGRHKFVDDKKADEDADEKRTEDAGKSDEVKKEEAEKKVDLSLAVESEKTKETSKEETAAPGGGAATGGGGGSGMMSGATPNLSAWFKAFGAPKVQSGKKGDKVDGKDADSKADDGQKAKDETVQKVSPPDISPGVDVPTVHGQPASRQRKVSTGSSVSERSSFSQDMDSPRVGIDERLLGAYPAPYPSPLHRSPSGASPLTVSPRPDASPKAPYPPFNGQMRVGFYQDTVSNKSSPDKSCSPRDNPQSPYAVQPAEQHVYPPNTTTQSAPYSYPNSPYYTHTPNYSNPHPNPTPPYNSESYYDTNKSLTDQYQAKVGYAAHSPSEQRSPAAVGIVETAYRGDEPKEKPNSNVFPVKKRAYNNEYEVDLNNRPQPVEDNKALADSYVNKPMVSPVQPQVQLQPQQQHQQQQDMMRGLSYPYGNAYGGDSNYPLNIPTRPPQQQDLDRKMDMSKYTNMGYTGPEVGFPRQQFNYPRPVGQNQGQLSQAPPGGDVSSLRYPNPNHLQMGQGQGYGGGAPTNSVASRPGYNPHHLELEQQQHQAMGMRGNIANLSHIVERYAGDERMLGAPPPGSQFYDKGAPPAPPGAHMFNKGAGSGASVLPIFSQAAVMQSYGQGMQATSSMYNRQMTELQSPMMGNGAGEAAKVVAASAPVTEKKTKKRKSKNAAAAVASEPAAPPNQGFQSYAGLKGTAPPSMEPSAISLKTASVVPGSAFNFGPTPTGLGLYGDKDTYANFLDDFRAAPNYYMAHHRAAPDAAGEKQTRAAHQASAPHPAPPYPFIGTPQGRPAGYPLGAPFMPAAQGPLMDAGSPLYQHYLQAGLNQGLLGPPGPYPPGYHPALSMRQPYDSMTRPSWL